MLWQDERYVRLYKRDTADWLALSFDAQALFCLLLRKVDLSGRLELGRHGPKAIAAVIGQVALWDERLKPALDELVKDGCVRIEGEFLLVPNYVAAQEARMSAKLRNRLHRERKGGVASRDDTETDDAPESRNASGTNRNASETPAGLAIRAVTPAFIQPVPVSSPDPAEPDRAREAEHESLPEKLKPLVEYVRKTWPEIPEPELAARSWAEAHRGIDLLAVAQQARAHQVSQTGKTYEIPAALLNKFFKTAAAEVARIAPNAGNGSGSYVMPADDDGKEKASRQKAATRKLLDDMRAQEKANAGVVVRHGRNGKS